MLRRRSTPAGQHRPVMLEQVLAVLDPQPGAVIVDCTVGWAGHAAELLRRAGPTGKLIGFDLDADNFTKARERLEPIGSSFSPHHGNFAGMANVFAADGIGCVDLVLADLGMSSMQVDDSERGFSYVRDGPLDMRMDRSRGKTAAQILAVINEKELSKALQEYGDEPEAEKIARAITVGRERTPPERTGDLVRIINEVLREGKPAEAWRLHPAPNKWNLHPAARTFQALRILVNRELANLEQLLRILPAVLNPGGRAAIISFHSGEDRLVKAAFRKGLRDGPYAKISDEPLRASFAERTDNPRARSAKLRWAIKRRD
ncbi:MAG: 16S rRNA (cytosine(1402)-N(4))-methyltransferase RsmH [Gemmataceae bacterium]